jgi:hypothetical protein
VIQVIVLILLLLFPQIALWPPSVLRYDLLFLAQGPRRGAGRLACRFGRASAMTPNTNREATLARVGGTLRLTEPPEQEGRLTRISHTVRRIGAPNQRKFFCEKDFAMIRGAPRCRQSVAQNDLILESWKAGLWKRPLMLDW